MISGRFIGVISGIRNGLAFILLIKCFYEEYFEGKTILKNIIFYIMSILIHPSAIVIILYRFVFREVFNGVP
jgi:hypothetical protein